MVLWFLGGGGVGLLIIVVFSLQRIIRVCMQVADTAEFIVI